MLLGREMGHEDQHAYACDQIQRQEQSAQSCLNFVMALIIEKILMNGMKWNLFFLQGLLHEARIQLDFMSRARKLRARCKDAIAPLYSFLRTNAKVEPVFSVRFLCRAS